MQFLYENEAGILCFNGGDGQWNIINYSGLALSEKSFTTVSYAEYPGQVTLRERTDARFITLRGDCRAAGEELSKGIRILNTKGCLWVMDGEKVRRIMAYCSHFELQKKRGRFREFVIQFTADDPYFYGKEAIQRALYSREDMVDSTFTLPCVFTKRIMDCTVKNEGDVSTEPIFTVHCKKAGAGDASGLLIENVTTGARLHLNYAMKTGETVTVDVPKRRIYSDLPTEENMEGNLIFCLSQDTILKNMYLLAGENRFYTQNFSTDSDLVAVCRFEEKYIEAVV